ncbi:hypothetical protein D3C78_1551940 [compost metagenome]
MLAEITERGEYDSAAPNTQAIHMFRVFFSREHPALLLLAIRREFCDRIARGCDQVVIPLESDGVMNIMNIARSRVDLYC